MRSAFSMTISGGVRYIDPDFDHGGRDQELDLTVLERAHRRLLCRAAPCVRGPADASSGSAAASACARFFRGLCATLLRFVDQRAHPVRLAPSAHAARMRIDHFIAARACNATVLTGVRPGGSSSMADTSRSAYAVIASVRGMGVAVMINWCGDVAARALVAQTPGVDARRSDVARRRWPARGCRIRRLPGTAHACRRRSALSPDATAASTACARLPVTVARSQATRTPERFEPDVADCARAVRRAVRSAP